MNISPLIKVQHHHSHLLLNLPVAAEYQIFPLNKKLFLKSIRQKAKQNHSIHIANSQICLEVCRTEPKNGFFGQILKPAYHSSGISRPYK